MKRCPVVFSSLLALLLTPCLLADTNIRSVRVSFVQGSVLVDHGLGKGFEPVLMNMPVTALTRFRTGDDGLAEIEFENGSTLRLTGETEVLFPRLSLLRDGRKLSLIRVRKGTVYVNVRPDKQNVFNLNGQTLHLEFGKKVHLRMTVDEEEVFVAVFRGNLFDADTGLQIGKNQSFKVDVKQNAIVAAAKGIDEYSTDAWDRQMDEQHKKAKNSPATFAGFAAFGGYSFGVDDCGYSPWLGLFSYWMPYCVYYYPNYYPAVVSQPGNPTKPVTPPGSVAITIGPRPGRPHIPPDGVVISALPNTVIKPPIVDLDRSSMAVSLHRGSRAPVQTVNSGGGQWTSTPSVSQDHLGRPAVPSNLNLPSASAFDRPSRPEVSNNAPHWTPVTPQPSSSSSASMWTHTSSPQMPSRPDVNTPSHSDSASYRPTPEPRPYSPPPSPPPAPSSPSPPPSVPASGASTTPTRPTH